MDTHLAVALAHLVFNVPLAVWILEGLHERYSARNRRNRAYIDGYSFRVFFLTIFPAADQVRRRASRHSSASLFSGWNCCWRARFTSVDAKPIVATMTRTVSAAGMDWARSPPPAS